MQLALSLLAEMAESSGQQRARFWTEAWCRTWRLNEAVNGVGMVRFRMVDGQVENGVH